MIESMKKLILFFAAAMMLISGADCEARKAGKQKEASNTLRLLYWNIQNGMWDGQDDNFDRFTAWVSEQHPDVCVWCEAQPIYKSGTADKLDEINEWRKDAPLIGFWEKMAARYGHKYVYLGGHRDNYPQVITSTLPIESVDRIVGAKPDSIVSHGAGWARIQVADRPINIVTLHTWPQVYTMTAKTPEEREQSKAVRGGDYYRRMEMEYICKHTVLTSRDAGKEYWMMMGDFNSISSKDNWIYQIAGSDSRFLVHDFILNDTPYIDIIGDLYPGAFFTSTGGRSRIDFVYATEPLMKCVKDARIVTDSYTNPVRDAKKISNFWHPSDHRPIIVNIEFK